MIPAPAEEMEAETLKYRAPAVAALASGRFAVFCPGWDPDRRVCGPDELHATITAYIEYNQLAPRAADQFTDEELHSLVEAIKSGELS